MRRLNNVAIIIETSSAYGRDLLRGVSRFHREYRAWSICFRPFSLTETLPNWYKSWHGDGILARIPNEKIASVLLTKKIPMIDLRGGALSLGLPPFGVDNMEVAEKAFTHLSNCGLKQFAFVGESGSCYYYDDERRKAFQNIVHGHGHTCHVFKHNSPKKMDDWEINLQELELWLRELPKPIGIFCCHDDRGLQVLEVCQRAGIGVPDEVAVLGVDNDEHLCGFSIPSLSSIDTNSECIGYEAAKLLHNLMNDKEEFDRPHRFKSGAIVVRQSTDIFACGDPIIASAIRMIRQNACNFLTVHDLLKTFGMSRSAFHDRFKRVVGHSAKQEIMRVQLDHAKDLLESTDKAIYEIAGLVGFEEAKYFVTVFRKHTGMTPKQYRLVGAESRHSLNEKPEQ